MIVIKWSKYLFIVTRIFNVKACLIERGFFLILLKFDDYPKKQVGYYNYFYVSVTEEEDLVITDDDENDEEEVRIVLFVRGWCDHSKYFAAVI